MGSSFASSGGVVHTAQQIITHPNFNINSLDNDIALLRLASIVTFTQSAQAGFIAGTGYIVPDNHPLWVIGWGNTEVIIVWFLLIDCEVQINFSDVYFYGQYFKYE